MGACAVQHFQNVSPEVWERLAKKAEAYGVPIRGCSGSDSAAGATFRWHYDPEAQTLEMQCLERPFFLPCSVVEHELAKLVEESRG
jgi:hypothetical protein